MLGQCRGRFACGVRGGRVVDIIKGRQIDKG